MRYKKIFLAGAMVCIVIAGVLARYVFSAPLAWSEELSKFLMIWMVLIGDKRRKRKRRVIE